MIRSERSPAPWDAINRVPTPFSLRSFNSVRTFWRKAMSQTKTSGSGEFVESGHPASDQAPRAGAQLLASEQARWLSMYEQMLKIRIFEEHVNQLYTSARMPGIAHLYIGEEAVAVGVCGALRRDDYITSTHRGHV